MGTVPFTMSGPLLRVCDSPDSPFLTEPEPHGYGKILGEALKFGCDLKNPGTNNCTKVFELWHKTVISEWLDEGF